MNELYDVLKASKASDFLIREEQTESREAFFIGQKLDMSRAKKVTHTFLTVFVDSEDGKFRGSAEKEIHQGISREEMKQEIDQARWRENKHSDSNNKNTEIDLQT